MPALRIARPVSDLARSRDMYRDGLGLEQIAQFTGHAGFDGVMLGNPAAGWHLEFTFCHAHPVTPAPTPEDLLVLYYAKQGEWQARCLAMLDAGFMRCEPYNPYWAQRGQCYVDHDGYQVIIQRGAWPIVT